MRNMRKLISTNDGTRTLMESIAASWPITQKQRDEFWSIVKQNGLESFCTKCTK